MNPGKTILSFALFFLFPLHAGAQMLYPISDAKLNGLRGPVKSVSRYSVEKKAIYTEDEIKEAMANGRRPAEYTRNLLTIDNFNEDGFYTECVDTVFRTRRTYMYFKPESGLGGKILSVKSYAEGKFDTYYDFNYDRLTGYPTSAKKVKVGVFDPVTMLNPIVFEEVSSFVETGDTLTQYHTQTYPDGRRILTQIDYDRNNHNILRILVVRNGAPGEATFFTEPNDISKAQKVIYDNPDYKTISMMEGEERVVFKRYPDGRDEVTSRIRYNDQGDPVSEVSATETKTYDYNYDSHGNWTRRVVVSPQGRRVTERDITYHD